MAPCFALRPRPTVAVVLSCCVALTACGGGDDESSGGADAPVTASAAFTPEQSVSRTKTLRITVKNTGTRTADAVAVVLTGLNERVERQVGIADPLRPVWIVDGAPNRGVGRNTDTWDVGPVAPGATRTFRWRLTPAVVGEHRLGWRVAASPEADVGVTEQRGVLPVAVENVG